MGLKHFLKERKERIGIECKLTESESYVSELLGECPDEKDFRDALAYLKIAITIAESFNATTGRLNYIPLKMHRQNAKLIENRYGIHINSFPYPVNS